MVGFAAETENLLANAAAKLRDKHLDFIVANDVCQKGAGFDVDTNIVTLVFPDGRTKPLEKMSKLEVAQRILDEVVAIRKAVRSRSRSQADGQVRQIRQVGESDCSPRPLGGEGGPQPPFSSAEAGRVRGS